MDDWLKKIQYIQTMDYQSAIRKDEILSFETTWVDLESIILSEISQTEQDKNNVIFHMWVRKQKAANKHAKQSDSQTQATVWRLPKERGLAGE